MGVFLGTHFWILAWKGLFGSDLYLGGLAMNFPAVCTQLWLASPSDSVEQIHTSLVVVGRDAAAPLSAAMTSCRGAEGGAWLAAFGTPEHLAHSAWPWRVLPQIPRPKKKPLNNRPEPPPPRTLLPLTCGKQAL